MKLNTHMLKKLELKLFNDFKKLFLILQRKLNIEFISTAFDLESLVFLKKVRTKKI